MSVNTSGNAFLAATFFLAGAFLAAAFFLAGALRAGAFRAGAFFAVFRLTAIFNILYQSMNAESSQKHGGFACCACIIAYDSAQSETLKNAFMPVKSMFLGLL
ncbi:hypothetical protein [Hyphococcus sp.]|uniref:hypothetical protein n=1 Tax=Hyphococcus sp. TaxID=2038636 RepID=UPI0035C6CAB0